MFGAYPALKLLQWQAREASERRMEQSIPDGQLTAFTDPAHNPDIRWENGGREFRYRGRMYDVVKVSYKSGKHILYCLDDSNETEICSLIEKENANRFGSSPVSNESRTIKLFIQVYPPLEKYCLKPSAFTELHPATQTYLHCSYANFYGQKISPPPELI